MVRINTPLPTVWLDGDFCQLAEARISVLDRGFLYGDGVYEILPVYGGRPLGPQRHIDRLLAGLAAIRIDDPGGGAAGWQSLIEALIEANGGGDIYVYIQVTRGAPANRDHAFPAGVEPTVFMMCAPMPALAPALIEQGVAAVTREDSRWARCDIKSISLLANVLLRQEAVEAGAAETILYAGDLVTEGSASSVFVVANGAIVTPRDGPEILPGTTRDLIVELAREDGLSAAMGEISRTDLANADEVWLCSSLREVLPVTRLDDTPVANGQPGPVFGRVHALYQDAKRALAQPA